MPACFSMLLSVPIGISRTGCGTVTRPGFTGCLNCLWLPTCATSYQPSCFKRCMTSRLDIRYDTHFLHTCKVGIYRISAAILDRVLEPGRFIYLDGRLGERAISTCNRSCRRVQTVPEFPELPLVCSQCICNWRPTSVQNRAFCAKSTLGYPLTLDRNRWHSLVECRGER